MFSVFAAGQLSYMGGLRNQRSQTTIAAQVKAHTYMSIECHVSSLSDPVGQ